MSLIIFHVMRVLLMYLSIGASVAFGAESMPMDGSVDQFYINYRHPIVREGRFLLGTIVVRNNNPHGFTLKFSSNNQSFLGKNENVAGIPYTVSIEQNNGILGNGVNKQYVENAPIQLTSDIPLLSTFNQTSYTDISLNVYINIQQSISNRLLAGTYKDLINVIYENQNNL